MNIRITNLNKSYNGKTVLKDFNAEFKENRVSCIMAPSGRGKTTLLNILMGLDSADSGTVSGIPEKIAAVFQEDRLCENFTVFTNVNITADSIYSEKDIKEKLKALGLSDEINSSVITLSGGQKRRVAIARALLCKSDILIMDEPFKGLDTNTKITVAEEIKKYNKTIIIVSHDEDEAKLMDAEIFAI